MRKSRTQKGAALLLYGKMYKDMRLFLYGFLDGFKNVQK